MRPVTFTILAGLGLALSACEGGGDPVEQAKQDALTANRAAAHPIDPEMLAASGSPTGQAIGSAADQAWVTAMIADHRQAIATAQTALAQSQDPRIRTAAQTIVDTRAREITELQAWTPPTR